VYAVDEGICKPRIVTTTAASASPAADHQLAVVYAFNTNTSKVVSTTFPISPMPAETPLLDLPQIEMAGVPGLASQITLEFLTPSGACTGSLLPTARPVDVVSVPHLPLPVRVSLVDATNPTVFVLSSDLHLAGPELSSPGAEAYAVLEALRRKGAERMGLDPTAQAQPKIAVLSDPSSFSPPETDVVIHAISMGVLHRAVPMTVGLCLGVAANVQGTLAWEIVRRSRARGVDRGLRNSVRMQHPSGVVNVGIKFSNDGRGQVESVSVSRTGKRLMKGVVWW
jgi:2-methylaconitate cis-trans-isomerase PrpF